MKREENLFLEDILENIKLIEDSIKKADKHEFGENRLLFDATIRRLEVIGEAVKNISDYLKNKYPEVPWRKIAGLRDILTHAYFGIENEIIWDIIGGDIPDLKQNIIKILEKEQDGRRGI